MTEHTTFNKGDHVEYLGCFTEGRPGVLLTSAPDDAPETTVLVNWDNGGQESVKIGALRNVTPVANSDGDQVSTGISLPCSLGRDQEAREGLERELWVADVDTTTEPRRVAIDYTGEHGTSPRELGWFDVRTMVRQLAEFAPDLVVLRREDLPEVTITEHITEPTTCTVDIGGVRRFSGADWTGHAVNAQYLHDQLTDARMKLATAESTIEHQRGRIQTLTDACQRKNSDCTRYAEERQTAIQARKAAENEAGDLRAQWAAYGTALARLENTPTPQVIGKNVVMRHETFTELEREVESLRDTWVTSDQYDRERKDHDETRRELRNMTAHARKWQRFAAVIELMEDAGDAELTIDGVQIRVVKP